VSAEHAGHGVRSGSSPLAAAGLCLGIGLGGFIEGILLHQILQWHHMLSSRVPPVTLATVNYNMMWDGAFHLMTWAMTVTGVALLFRAGQRGATMSGSMLLGAMLGGWGLFTVVEGLIDHQLLGVHHVRPGPDLLAWDLGYLIFGAALMVIGAVLARGGGDA
jgi:uncharacterized membrane protein